MNARMRIDRLLVARGLFESRAKAQAAIAAGLVIADDVPVSRASDEIAADAVLRATAAHPYVSRGGVKLAAALDHFGVDPAGQVCLDVGASTGGFTEVLLMRRACHVDAVDVGHGQLHPSLQGRRDVSSIEGTDIRALDPARLAEPPGIATIDVSFISLKLVLPPVHKLLAPGAWLLALIKPQFEAGRAHIRKGIVRDPQTHAAVCDEIASCAASLGFRVMGTIESPLRGADGNREFFFGAVRD